MLKVVNVLSREFEELPDFSFTKSSRILLSGVFRSILNKPLHRLSDKTLTLLAVKNDCNHPRLGIIVSKKKFSRAITRNSIKRIIRESFRLKQTHLGSFDFLIIARRDIIKFKPSERHQQVDHLWLRFSAIVRKAFFFLIRFYQLAVSPLLGPRCRFEPSCSHYAMRAIEKYGIIKGIRLSCIRLLKCHPWHPGGHDPVNINLILNKCK